MSDDLIGKNVKILRNDFQLQDTTAKIIMVDNINRKLLLELDEIIINKNITYSYAVATIKLSFEKKEILFTGDFLTCAVIWVSNDQFNYAQPFDTGWWRGGAADTTDLRLLNYDFHCSECSAK